MKCDKTKGISSHMKNAKIQIRLRMRTVLSESAHFAYIIADRGGICTKKKNLMQSDLVLRCPYMQQGAFSLVKSRLR